MGAAGALLGSSPRALLYVEGRGSLVELDFELERLPDVRLAVSAAREKWDARRGMLLAGRGGGGMGGCARATRQDRKSVV